MVFQKAITEFCLCNQTRYYFLSDAFNLLDAKLFLLQSVLEVFQMSLLVKKLLDSFCYRGLTSIMCCDHPLIKIHTPFESFPDSDDQFYRSLAAEIHEFKLYLQVLSSLLWQMLRKCCNSFSPSHLTVNNFCNY